MHWRRLVAAIRNFHVRESTDYIVVHTTGSDDDIGAREIRRQHLAKYWLDIGYHFVIRRNGTIEPGRITSAPSEFEPKPSVAICLVGDDEITTEQALSLRSLLIQLIDEYPSAEIYPRCQISNFNFQGELNGNSQRNGPAADVADAGAQGGETSA